MVVGMSEYWNIGRLHAPDQDVNTTSLNLQLAKFETMKKENLTRAQFYASLERFTDELRQGVEQTKERVFPRTHVALFYYSGHGRQIGNDMLLYPVDAREGKEEEDGIPLSSVITEIKATGIEIVIVVIDACRTGSDGIGIQTQPNSKTIDTDVFLLYSTSPGAESLQGEQISLFTELFNAHMLDAGVSIADIATLTGRDVFYDSGRTMVPWQHSSLKEPFYFVPKGEQAPLVREGERVAVWVGGMPIPVTVSDSVPFPTGWEEEEKETPQSSPSDGQSGEQQGGGQGGDGDEDEGKESDSTKNEATKDETTKDETMKDEATKDETTGPMIRDGGGAKPTEPTNQRLSGLSRRDRWIVGLTVGGAGVLAAGGAVLPYWWTIRNDAKRLVGTTPGYEEGTTARASYLAKEEERARRYLIGSTVTMGVGAALAATGTGLLLGRRDGRSRNFPVLGKGLGTLLIIGGGTAAVGGGAVMAGWWTVRNDAEERADQEPGYEEGTEARREYLAAQEKQARSYLYQGAAIAGGGAVALIVGGALVGRANRREKKQPSPARVVPVMGLGFGGVSVEGRF